MPAIQATCLQALGPFKKCPLLEIKNVGFYVVVTSDADVLLARHTISPPPPPQSWGGRLRDEAKEPLHRRLVMWLVSPLSVGLQEMPVSRSWTVLLLNYVQSNFRNC